ncbi:MAG: thioredoxin family protein [Planctomyces sp.]|nr:thioredoxin family protein [Planctomyces sp.]MBA4120682.1 thioredoxin family protein [Isosphaera sp.]
MAATASTMLELGTRAPGFTLPDTTRRGAVVSLADLAGSRALLVMFLCNHCPFVKHVRGELARLGRDYQPRGVAVVAISSNDPEAYPDDSPEKMTAEAGDAGYTFPYLFDATQEVAKAYRAACTPDFFVFDGAQGLVYRGQLDDSRPSTRSFQGTPTPVTGADVRAALDAVLAGRAVPQPQKPSIGCNIKWRPGNAPGYAR